MNEPTQKYSLRDLCACAEREIRFRQKIYPRLVGDRKMTQGKADMEIAMMTEIADRLRRAAAHQEKQTGGT